ncbi:MAG TPA: cytochrome C, partial [Geobacteraceae bacterium]
MKRAATITIFTFLLSQGGAFAHEGEHHAKGHNEDARMAKLHKIMPMYAQAQTKIDEALIKRDTATVKKETGKILATIPDLKNAKPHKNINELATFRKMASAFAEDVEKTDAMVKRGDFEGARIAF